MIVLDTNVVSEMMKAAPNISVRDWINRQDATTLYITSITLSESLFGVAILPTGKRRDALSITLNGLLKLFAGKILPFDETAARCYAERAAQAQAAGNILPLADGYIAAIAAAHRFMVASRDTAPFQAAGVNIINPWKDGGKDIHAQR